MPLSPGAILKDRYRIEALLVQGGMGAVYMAWDTNLGVRCAVKENLIMTEAAGRSSSTKPECWRRCATRISPASPTIS